MAGGYRCSHGHAWSPPDGAEAATCPVCGDTIVIAVAEGKQAVFVVGAGAAPAGGQDATQSLPLAGAGAEHAPTVAFTPPAAANGSHPTDASFPSLAVLIPEEGGSSAAARSGDSSIVPFGPTGTVLQSPAEAAVSGSDSRTAPLVPGYEVIREVGRGGMGVVYKARQVSLNRPVALKMILAGSHAGPAERERFRREAESVAALSHPHIVQIFDIGEADGHPYLALEFVEGGSLAQQLDGQPWDATRAAELVETLARAMQFAHEHGIVHRDLKPGNILLGKDEGGRMKGEGKSAASDSSFNLPPSSFRPKVSDFGLAKRLGETLGDGSGTRTGAVLGTPSYIAPEQAGGKARDVGPATDVYALGAILYELLTGRPPFRGETPLDTVLQVLHDDPVPPKRLHPLVPRDLETICLKCLQKPRGKRYGSAAALADDLRRFLRGEPIKARPLSAWGRGVKWARRHPSLAVLISATVAATVALVAVLSVAYFRVRDAVSAQEHEKVLAQRERDRAEGEKKRAEDLAAENARRRTEAEREAEERKREADRARRAAYALQLSQVAILCERDPLRAAALLEDETRCPRDLRDFTWNYLRRLCQREDRSYLDHQPDDPLRAVAYSPRATFVATAGDAGSIRLWDPRTGRTWLTLTGHAGPVHGLAFSPDGTVVASAGADRSVRLWVLPLDTIALADTAMGWLRRLDPQAVPAVKPPSLAPAVTLSDAHEGEVMCVAFSPDGRALVSGGQDGAVRWWDLTAWRPAPVEVAGLGGPAAAGVTLTRAAQKAPDARPVWATRKWQAHPRGVLCLAFSHDGRFLVTGGNDRLVKVWTGDGRFPVRTLPRHADVVRAVAVTPDGSTVATANNPTNDNQPPTVRLFDTRTWRERRLFGHTKSIYALEMSEDGRLLASAGFDKTVRLWEVGDGRERGTLTGHSQLVSALAFSPDRRTLVSAGMDGAAVVWQTALSTHEPGEVLQFSRDPFGKPAAQGLTAAAIGGGAGHILTADDVAGVQLLTTNLAPANRTPLPGAPGSLALTPLANVLPTLKSAARAAAVSPDGRVFVAAFDTGLRVWRPDPQGGRPFWPGAKVNAPARATLVRTPAPVHALAIDPTNRWLVTADPDAVRLYDLHDIPAGPQPVIDPKGGTLVMGAADVREVAFHPTRGVMAVAVGGGLRLVTLQGRVLADVPRAHGRLVSGSEVAPKVEALAFDAQGRRLATGDESGLIRVWSLDEGGGLTLLHDLTGHAGAIHALAFTPDGLTLASGGDDRAVILWDPVGRRERLALTGHADRVLRLAFKPDGSALVTLGRDGSVKRWRADLRAAPDAGPRLPQPLEGK